MMKSYPDQITLWQKIGAWLDAMAMIEMNDGSGVEKRLIALENRLKLIEEKSHS